jgi:hypothetical protein
MRQVIHPPSVAYPSARQKASFARVRPPLNSGTAGQLLALSKRSPGISRHHPSAGTTAELFRARGLPVELINLAPPSLKLLLSLTDSSFIKAPSDRRPHPYHKNLALAGLVPMTTRWCSHAM